jgi:hypothetical protein
MQEEVESMVCRSTVACAVLLLGALVASPATAEFVVDIKANIADANPIVGWGFDIWFDESVTGPGTIVAYGPDWLGLAAPTPDPDDPSVDLNLEAITVWPDPLPGVTGNEVLLASISFPGAGTGDSLTLGDHNPWNGLGDWNEGFIIQPPPTCNFAQVGYVDLNPDPFIITIPVPIPEPTSLALLLLGGLAVIRRR